MNILEGVHTLDEMGEFLPKMSLVHQGLLGKPMAPMLIIAGVLDTQVPIEDEYLLLSKGDVPKEAWINPRGGHLGRQVGVWPDPRIFKASNHSVAGENAAKAPANLVWSNGSASFKAKARTAISPRPRSGVRNMVGPPYQIHVIVNYASTQSRPSSPTLPRRDQALLRLALGAGEHRHCGWRSSSAISVPRTRVAMKPLGDAFIRMITMIITVMIFCTVVTGIAGMQDLRKVGRVGGKALLYFEIISTLALVVGLIVGNVVHPGSGFNVNPTTLDAHAVAEYAGQAKAADRHRLSDAHHSDDDRRTPLPRATSWKWCSSRFCSALPCRRRARTPSLWSRCWNRSPRSCFAW